MNQIDLRKIAIALAVAPLLFILFIKAQAPDPIRHHRILTDLHTIESMNAEIDILTLKFRYRLQSNYDGLVSAINEISLRQSELRAGEHAIFNKGNEKIDRAMEELDQALSKKTEWLEGFKSHNAVLNNSLHYFPRIVEETMRLARSDRTLQIKLQSLMHNLLMLHMGRGDSDGPGKAEYSLRQIEAHAYPPSLQENIDLLLQHAKYILKYEQEINRRIQQITSASTRDLVRELTSAYEESFNHAFKIANYYYFFIFLAAISLFAYAAYSFFRLRENASNLHDAYAEIRNQKFAMDQHAIVSIADASGDIIYANDKFCEISHYSRNELYGHNHRIVKSNTHPPSFYQELWKTITSGQVWHGEICNKAKDDSLYWVDSTIVPFLDEKGIPIQYISIRTDITERKMAAETILYQANFDPLTHLPNRRLLHDRLEQEIKMANRSGLPLALMFIDLDHFKDINDTLGHDMGDILLKEAAQRLSSCVRGADTIARMGGDEFTVIMGELDDLGSVERAAQNILRKLAEPFQLLGEVAYISASIGITLYPEDAMDIDELLKNSDQAMYAAKHQGRNCFSYFTPSMQEAAQNRMRLASDLRGALVGNQLSVFYQPIVELATGAIYKAEALIRWQHPKRGLISPTEFISIAEETGMIIDIGDWVFREASLQAARWRESHYEKFQISVNVSPVQLHNVGNIPATWFQHLQKLGLPGKSIVVEITEGLLLDASPAVIDQLLGFRDAGIEVSLDDFGTGYSSLSYLNKFDIDYLKIDQSFIRNLTRSSDDVALCEAIIVMAHKLGLKVIAEGVETKEQRDLLAAAACDYVQGYLFSEALSVEDFEALLKRS